MNFLLNTNANNLLDGLETFFVGILIVFAVLVLIMLALKLFQLLFAKNTSNAKNTTPATIESTVVQAANYDDEIVAVIAAAIAMAESETNGLKFRVVSFRRK